MLTFYFNQNKKGLTKIGQTPCYQWYRRRDLNSQGLAPGGFWVLRLALDRQRLDFSGRRQGSGFCGRRSAAWPNDRVWVVRVLVCQAPIRRRWRKSLCMLAIRRAANCSRRTLPRKVDWPCHTSWMEVRGIVEPSFRLCSERADGRLPSVPTQRQRCGCVPWPRDWQGGLRREEEVGRGPTRRLDTYAERPPQAAPFQRRSGATLKFIFISW